MDLFEKFLQILKNTNFHYGFLTYDNARTSPFA